MNNLKVASYANFLPRKIKTSIKCQVLCSQGFRCGRTAQYEITYHGDDEYSGPGEWNECIGWVSLFVCDKHAESHVYYLSKKMVKKKMGKINPACEICKMPCCRRKDVLTDS